MFGPLQSRLLFSLTIKYGVCVGGRLGDISNYVHLRKWHLFSLRQHIKFFKSEPRFEKKNDNKN